MWCGPKSCRPGKGRSACPVGQSCAPIKEEHCFVKPCLSLGECWPPAPPPPSKCHASFSNQDNSCANITFTFNKENMPQVSHTFKGRDWIMSFWAVFPRLQTSSPPFSNSTKSSGAWKIRFSSSRRRRFSRVKFSRLAQFSQALLSYPNKLFFAFWKKCKKYILYNKPWLGVLFQTEAFQS